MDKSTVRSLKSPGLHHVSNNNQTPGHVEQRAASTLLSAVLAHAGQEALIHLSRHQSGISALRYIRGREHTRTAPGRSISAAL